MSKKNLDPNPYIAVRTRSGSDSIYSIHGSKTLSRIGNMNEKSVLEIDQLRRLNECVIVINVSMKETKYI